MALANMYGSGSQNIRWWLEPEGRRHEAVFASVEHIEKIDRTTRFEADRIHARLYGGQDLAGLSSGGYYRTTDPSRIMLNIIAAMVDTLEAKVGKNKPRPYYLPADAPWRLHRKAKLRNQFAEGLLHKTGAYRIGPACFRDSSVFGSGFCKVYSQNSKICMERVYPWEIFVDPVEAFYGSPRQLFQSKLYDRQVLIENFPKHQEAIEKAPRAEEGTRGMTFRDNLADQVRVVEAWRLPSGSMAGDGAHIISINGADLQPDDSWDRDRFPIAKIDWKRRLFGWFGAGLVEELVGIQYEINILLQKIQEAMIVAAKPWIFCKVGSGVQEGHITDEIDSVIFYTGDTPPQVFTFRALPPELYQHLETLIARAFEVSGISQLSAASRKPAGLNAAVALREFRDIESERFARQIQNYDHFFVDLIELAMQEAASIPGYAVEFPDARAAKVVKWAEVGDSEHFVLKSFPASSLPSEPWAKMQSVQEMIQNGILPEEEGLRLLDLPDLDKHLSFRTAGYDLADEVVERILYEGEPWSPEPHMPLEYTVKLARQAIMKGRLQGVPEENLELLRAFEVDAVSLIEAAQPQPPPQAMPGPAPVPGAAGAGPQEGMPLAGPETLVA